MEEDERESECVEEPQCFQQGCDELKDGLGDDYVPDDNPHDPFVILMWSLVFLWICLAACVMACVGVRW